MRTEQDRFVGAGAKEIFWRAWLPDTIRGLCIIAHGLGEHSGRYEHVARALGERDLASFALDHRGHGQSGGKRGHVLSFSEYLFDLDNFRRLIEERFSELPRFLIGHSMGGLIAAHYAAKHGAGLSGLVLSSPALRVDVKEPEIKLALGKLMSRVLPGLTMGNGLDPEMISHDKEVVAAYKNDPLVHDRVSARWFTEFTSAIEAVHECAHQISTPVLLMQSGEDELVAPRGAQEFFDRLTVEDKTLKVWEGFYHEMMNETEKEKAIDLMLEWIEKRLG